MIHKHRTQRVLLCLVLLGSLLSAHAAEAPPSRHAPSASASAPAAGSIDVNQASEADLVAIPGVGKSLAHRIVEFREKNGPFQRVDDLMKVQGIGEKSLQKLRPYVTVGKAR